MGLIGYTPAVNVTGAGAKTINARLLEWEHVDAAGVESDRLKLVVDTTGIEDGLPTEGAEIGFEVGYVETGLVNRGRFTISRITPQLFPSRLTIVATAAPFKVADDTEFKRRRSASYGPATLGEIFRELTKRHGFSPRVAPKLEAVAIGHIDQTDETDMAFLTRLAGKFDAVTKPYGSRYVLAPRGEVKSISGQSIPTTTVGVPPANKPEAATFVNASLEESSRKTASGVRGKWSNADGGKYEYVEVGKKPFKSLRHPHATKDEAEAACRAEMRKLDREKRRIVLDLPGDPSLAAEGLVVTDSTWPAPYRGTWSIDRVTARGSRSGGYRCTVRCLVPGAKSEK